MLLSLVDFLSHTKKGRDPMARPPRLPRTPASTDDLTTMLESLLLADLRPHPRNDGSHPPEELAHLKQSLTEHGIYRNVVVAQDGTILAGHGVVQAAQELGHTHIAGKRMPYGPDEPQALKLLAGDNHIARLRVQDDALLAALLQELAQDDPTALLRTGFDEGTLADLVEQQSLALHHLDRQVGENDPEAEWQGMPGFHQDNQLAWKQLIVNFASLEDLQAFAALLQQSMTEQTRSIWYPYHAPENLQQYRYVDGP
jgi:hypothetical protein